MMVTQWEGTECMTSSRCVCCTYIQWQVGLAGDGYATELWVTGWDRMYDFIQVCLLHLLNTQWQVGLAGDGHTNWTVGYGKD